LVALVGQRIFCIITIIPGDRPSMDTTLLKTFLEVARLRHFGKAADRLFVTQSAVSARIKQLEDTLGVTLFSRKRNDIQLTAAGQRLRAHAETIVRAWERARKELALQPGVSASLAVGHAPDLWEIVGRDWVLAAKAAHPDLALHLELGPQTALAEGLQVGRLDLIVVFDAPAANDLALHDLGRVRLQLVSSRSALSPAKALSERYILVDWGTSFAISHQRHFGELATPMIRVTQGRQALDLILAEGGSAYLPQSQVAAAVAAGRLHLVADAPVIERGVVAVHRAGRDDDDLLQALVGLQRKLLRRPED
jgi:DNA-binding transcriptional LysR family regulator